MCGFSGFFSLDKNAKTLKNNLSFKSLSHRGPDDNKNFINENFYCEFYRLSIIGGKRGVQPMISNDKNFLIIFNGEIFNYIELANQYLNLRYKEDMSDTEVLLLLFQKFGTEMVKLINGMFSIVVFDIKKNKVFLFRDRFGTKPLYYSIKNRVLFFSSEIKGIPITKNVNIDVVKDYLTFGYYPKLKTFYKNIYNLDPSHFISFDNISFQKKKYFDLKSEVNKKKDLKFKNKKEYLEEFNQTLINSINLRQRTTRKLNFHLSGGIDSNALLALTYKNWSKNYNLETSTYSYQGFKRNEYDTAKKISDKFNIKNYKVILKSSEIPSLSKKLQYYQDEPYGGLAAVAEYKQNIQQKKMGSIVSFEGMGGDEIFGGYNSHIYLLVRDLFYSRRNEKLLKEIVSFLNLKLNVILKLSDAFIRSGFNGNTDLSQIRKARNVKINNKKNYYDIITYKEIFDGSLNRTLRFRDRSSAACGRELRFPLLDHRVVILGLSMPLDLKFMNGFNKFPLRSIVGQFNKNVSLEKKKSNNSAQTQWLTGELKQWAIDNIESLNSKKVVEKVHLYNFKKSLNKNLNNSFYIWQLINLNLFYENLKKYD